MVHIRRLRENWRPTPPTRSTCSPSGGWATAWPRRSGREGRNLRRTLVAAGLVAASAVLVLVLAVAGGCWPLLSPLPGRAARGTPPWTSSPPPWCGRRGYAFTGGEYLAEKELYGPCWWTRGRRRGVATGQTPPMCPTATPLTDVAAFTRWYLSDYRYRYGYGRTVCWWRAARGEHLEAPFCLGYGCAEDHPFLVLRAVSAGPAGVLGLTALVLGRQFRQEQQERDLPARLDQRHLP